MSTSGSTGADNARAIIQSFGRVSLLVVGDVMLDQFVVGRVSRISPEAPVPVVEHDHDEFRIGGAGNVAHNARALGARVELVGLVGSDPSGERLRDGLERLKIGCTGLIVDAQRPTTTKQRIVTTRNQQVARVDYETDVEAAGPIEERLIEEVVRRLPQAAAIVVSDYLKGAVTRRLLEYIVLRARERSIPVLVDPKIPHIEYYAGATIVTPNNHEAEVATHLLIRTEDDIRRAGLVFMERAKCESVLITRGEHGMNLVDRAGATHFPAVAREVADVTGAGDTVIAALAMGLAAGGEIPDSALIANHAAGIVVGKFGPATVSPAELLASLQAAG